MAYDGLFPQNPATTAFLLKLLAQGRPADGEQLGAQAGPKVLDLGSATGSQALDLAASGCQATGLEPCEAMLKLAMLKATERGLPARFAKGGMLDAAERTQPRSLDLLLCLGNTLPHLDGSGELAALFRGAASMLKPGAAFVLQLLNYERILPLLEAKAFTFPDIECGTTRFSRRYATRIDGRLTFHTELTVEGETTQSDESTLTPFTLGAIEAELHDSGFEAPERYATWQGRAFDRENDAYLILVARHPLK